jgi:hypothetical protein
MGNCFCCSAYSEYDVEEAQKVPDDVRVALKFPHGLAGVEYNRTVQDFLPLPNINTWLTALYRGSTWTHFLVYNDETSHLGNTKHTKGHCKGILTWNAKQIGWLIHSVPNFPRKFTGKTISEIEHSEIMYGQSFCYIEYAFTDALRDHILRHIATMEAHIFLRKGLSSLPPPMKFNQVHVLPFSPQVRHLAKYAKYEIDLYADCICQYDTALWRVETWKRGSPLCPQTGGGNVRDIEHLAFQTTTYKESQDHSKWAVCPTMFFIGDLNRMASQRKRGGGGILVHHPVMAQAFQRLIVL